MSSFKRHSIDLSDVIRNKIHQVPKPLGNLIGALKGFIVLLVEAINCGSAPFRDSGDNEYGKFARQFDLSHSGNLLL